MAIKINKDIQIDTTGVSLENLQKYSTNENKIGTWIDGKSIYRKVINLGTLPNQNNLLVPSGLSNITPMKVYGCAIKNGVEAFPLPFIWGDTNNVQNYCGIFYDMSNNRIYFRTNRDMSSYIGYAIVEYTKNN